jgi:hypothetical protein
MPMASPLFILINRILHHNYNRLDRIQSLQIANPVFYAQTKHIEIDFHFVREKVAQRALDVMFVSSEDQMADAFTKPATKLMLERFKANLNIVSHVSLLINLYL